MKTNLFSTMRNKIFCACTMLVFALLTGISANGQCTYYQDSDNDTYGNLAVSYVDANCDPPVTGYVANNNDCNDSDPTIRPFTIFQLPFLTDPCDGIDQNCNGIDGLDSDGDGYSSCTGDCNDSPFGGGSTYPGATERCGDGIDNDCDGTVDNGIPQTYYIDGDLDEYGGAVAGISCAALSPGFTYIGGDCNDSEPTIFPYINSPFNSLDEPCDGIDQNCDGIDGFDDDNDGYSTCTGDCNDGPFYFISALIHPGATEVCGDGRDNNCDGQMDEGLLTLYYWDEDGDGFGIDPNPVLLCSPNLFYTALQGGDCDDNNATYTDSDGDGFGALPAVPCGAVYNDDDCDDSQYWYIDNDGDGFGAEPPIPCGGINNNLDCDDAYEGYSDNDGDGFGAYPPVPCGGPTNISDCNDNNAGINPNAIEIFCDGIDNNCNYQIDEGNTLTVDAGPNKIVYKGYPDSASARLQSTITGGVGPYARQWSSAVNPSLGNTEFITVSPPSTTVYYLTVTDANGCTVTDSVKVCVVDVRCGKGNKSVIVCHGTGSASNPFVTMCLDKAGAKWHFINHPGEQLAACGTAKTCDWDTQTKRLAETDFPELADESEYLDAFPNPFENTTTIRFMLPDNDFVNVRVLDITGREIKKLYDEATEAGIMYELTFDGSVFSKGMYFLLMQSQNGLRQTKKLILEK